MSEDDIIIDQQVIDGYNAGYTLQQHEPELLDKILLSSDRNSEYIKAMAQGKQQYEREKIMREQQHIKERQQEKKRGR